MNFKEWLNRREMIKEGTSFNDTTKSREVNAFTRIKAIIDAYISSKIKAEEAKKIYNIFLGYYKNNDKDADKKVDPSELMPYFQDKENYKVMQNLEKAAFVFFISYIRDFEKDIKVKAITSSSGINKDSYKNLDLDSEENLKYKNFFDNGNNDFSDCIANIKELHIDPIFKTKIGDTTDAYENILKIFKEFKAGRNVFKTEEEKQNVEEKSDNKTDTDNSTKLDDEKQNVEEKSDNKIDTDNSTKLDDEKQNDDVSATMNFAGSREWGIPKPDKSLDYERAVESYKDALEAYEKKAIEKLEDIMGAISKRHDAAVEQENARTEANKAEADRYSNMKYTPSSITTEMFELASKYNHTINEAFLRKLKDKAIGLSKTASDERDKLRASDNSSLIDEYKEMIHSKIEKYKENSADLLRKYKFGGKGGRVSGTKVQDGNYGLITLFINLERDLNKILDKAKKDAGPSFAQRRAKEKQEWKDYKDRLNKNSPEYQAKESRKESAANTMYNKLIDFLHREQSSDCLKILRMELIRTINDANNSEALRNVLNYGNGNQDYKIYDTKPGEYDFSKKGSLGTFGSIFDTRAGVGITQADLASLKDKDKDVWEKIKSGIRSDKVLTDAINDYNKYNNTRRRADDLLAQKMNQSTRVGTLDLNEFPKIDGTNGIQLNDSGMEDVAFRQALADKKYIVKMEGSVITYATDKNAFKKQEQIAKQNEVNTAANAGKPTENVDMQDWNSSVKTKPTATVTTAAADGLPTGLYRKVMRRKIW